MYLGAIWPIEPFWNLENNNATRFAIFLRLGTTAVRQTTDLGPKTQRIDRETAHFRFAKTEENP